MAEVPRIYRINLSVAVFIFHLICEFVFNHSSSGPKNKRRKHDRRVSSRDRRADYYEESGSPHHEHHSGSGSREARYSDMAPKYVQFFNFLVSSQQKKIK